MTLILASLGILDYKNYVCSILIFVTLLRINER